MNEIPCPTCGHSLAFHPYDDSDDGCQAPIGGLTSHHKCGCPLTIHIFIQSLQKQNRIEELEKLKVEHADYVKHLVDSRTIMSTALERIKFLEGQLGNIKDILNEAKLVDSGPFYGHFKINYKKQIHELLDKAIFEIEKEKHEQI